jgi:hypothetical protein
MSCIVCVFKAKQSSKETAAREATGSDHPRFSNQLALCSQSIHVDAATLSQNLPADPTPNEPKDKPKKAPLAERLQDMWGAHYRIVLSGCI